MQIWATSCSPHLLLSSSLWYAAVIPLIARITGLPDRLDVAEAAAQTVLSSSSVTPDAAQIASCGLALLAVVRRDVAAAQQQYDSLQQGSQVATLANTIGSIDRFLGLLAETMGALDKAAQHFEVALAFYRTGYRPELAWTCCDYADTLLQRNEPGDREKAMSLLDESLAISRELGMRPLMERVLNHRDRVELSPEASPAYPDGLTQREVEVLCLIARGKSNPEIAQELFISVRTVSTHVSNILNKISATNRAEAATYATRHGML